MKKLLTYAIAALMIITFNQSGNAQDRPATNLIHVTMLKQVWPEKGSARERDSLIAIYNANVINKNEHILSHREFAHFFTNDNRDYMVVEEFKDFAGWEAAVEKIEKLEKAAWPDEAKFDAFMKEMNKYFENWHGDMLMNMNPKLSKN